MMTPQEKLKMIRLGQNNPGVAIAMAIESMRAEIRILMEEGLAKIEAQLPERAILKNIEKLKGEIGPAGKDADHQSIVKDILPKAIRAVMAAIRLPQDGRTPTDAHLSSIIKGLLPPPAKDGKTPTSQEILALIKPLIPKVDTKKMMTDDEILSLIEKHTIKIFEEETGESIVNKINKIPTGSLSRINASHIVLPREKGPGTKGKYHAAHGAGGGGVGAVKAVTLSGLNGVLKTFTIPSNTAILSVHFSSAPIIANPSTDFTSTATSITFTSQINAISTLASDQTVQVVYIEG